MAPLVRRPSLGMFFELGAAIGMRKKVVPIVPKDLDPDALPFDLRLRRYVIRQSPEETADALSRSLSSAEKTSPKENDSAA